LGFAAGAQHHRAHDDSLDRDTVPPPPRSADRPMVMAIVTAETIALNARARAALSQPHDTWHEQKGRRGSANSSADGIGRTDSGDEQSTKVCS